MLEFLVDWQKAPGVKHPVLSQTWCRLTIHAGGHLVSRVYDRRTKGSRIAVYGSVFPLCAWMVENYWFLISEAYRWAARYGSRDLARNQSDRAWVQRHSLLAAREGGALPDLTIYRDGDMVMAHWLKDGGDNTNENIRFGGEGWVRLSPSDARESISQFVEIVLDRVSDMDHDEVLQLREDWTEIQHLSEAEQQVFEWAARLGIDARFDDDLTLDDEEYLRTQVTQLDKGVAEDLLNSSAMCHLREDVSWIQEAHTVARKVSVNGNSRVTQNAPPLEQKQTAHETGHAHALAYRGAINIPNVIKDMQDVVRDLGWADEPFAMTNSSPASVIRGVLEYVNGQVPVVVTHSENDDTPAGRFLLARSLYMQNSTRSGVPRLVTDSHTWDQRASRSFAAEILAPAHALETRIISRKVSPMHVSHLAEEFGVSTELVQHQIENYDIATLEKPPLSHALW